MDVSKFRPISLINVAGKVLKKILRIIIILTKITALTPINSDLLQKERN
jgi:hypothetical protein